MHKNTVRTVFFWGIIVVAGVLFWRNVHHYYSINYTQDDSFVSMVYARRLLEGHGLTWTDGVRVEGYSNFLWLMAQAGLAWLGMDLFETSRVLGIFGMSLMFLGSILVFRKVSGGSLVPMAFVLMALALSHPMAIWAVGGLEVSFIVGFLSFGLFLVFREMDQESMRPWYWVLAGMPFGLMCLTRPDSPLIVIAISIGVFLALGFSQKTLAKVVLFSVVPIGFTLSLLIFRLLYYGEWVPNTALVKVPIGFSFLTKLGVEYLGSLYYYRGLWIVSLLVIPAFFWGNQELRKKILVLSSVMLLWMMYLVYIGGDFFAGIRHLLPVLLVLIWAAGFGLLWLVNQRVLIQKTYLGLVLCVVLAADLVFYSLDQVREENTSVITAKHDNFRWKWLGEALDENLGRAFGQRGEEVVIATNGVGTIPYHTRWNTICMLGLTDKWLPRHPPGNPVFTDMPGHQLGNADYILSRRPDLIMVGGHFGGRCSTLFQTDYELCGNPKFLADYRFVEFAQSIGPRVRIWARFESRAVGVIRSDGFIEVPSYLLDAEQADRLMLDDSLLLPVHAGSKVVARDLLLPAGRWFITAKIREGNKSMEIPVRNGVSGNLLIVIDKDSVVSLEVQISSEKLLESLIFQKD